MTTNNASAEHMALRNILTFAKSLCMVVARWRRRRNIDQRIVVLPSRAPRKQATDAEVVMHFRIVTPMLLCGGKFC